MHLTLFFSFFFPFCRSALQTIFGNILKTWVGLLMWQMIRILFLSDWWQIYFTRTTSDFVVIALLYPFFFPKFPTCCVFHLFEVFWPIKRKSWNKIFPFHIIISFKMICNLNNIKTWQFKTVKVSILNSRNWSTRTSQLESILSCERNLSFQLNSCLVKKFYFNCAQMLIWRQQVKHQVVKLKHHFLKNTNKVGRHGGIFTHEIFSSTFLHLRNLTTLCLLII